MEIAETASIALEVAFEVIKIGADYASMLKYRHLIYVYETANIVTFIFELSLKDMDTAVLLAIIFGANMPQGLKFWVNWNVCKRADCQSQLGCIV